MILGMPPFTFIHVLLSLIGIATGFVVVLGFLSGKQFHTWTWLFLATTALTSVTGFFLPAKHLMPSHILGLLSLLALAFALYALYSKHLSGAWRRTYVISAVVALYFNFFVLIAQSFQKVPSLKTLAPTGSEPPFLIAQCVALLFFILLGVFASIKFHPSDTLRPA